MQRSKRNRQGAAVTELAISLPMIFILLIGSLEVCGRVFLQESLQIAAYEAGIVAARKSGTTSSVSQRVTAILGGRSVRSYTVTVSPTPEVASKGTTMVVTVSAPSSANSIVPTSRFASMTMSAQVSVVKEDK